MTISKQTGIIAGGAGLLAAAVITTFMLVSSSTIHVAPGEDLQAAINAAPCGSVIELDAGGVYAANLTLPNKDCTDFTTIQSSRASELPEGQRIDPVAQAGLLVKLQSTVNAEPVIKTASSAHHYKFIGVEIATRDTGVFVYDLIRFGRGRPEQSTLESVPHHLVLDRSYVHGIDNQDTQRGVSLNCADCGVTNSYVTNVKAQGMDTQAICGWNGTLRAYIINNYLEAGAEIVMMGGSDPAQESMIPRNVEVRRNTIRRPVEWKGKGYTIKNLIEAKNIIGFTIDGNVMENNWANEGQSGPCLLATVRNQEGSAPYSTINNYVVTNNIVRNCEGVFNFLGSDNEKPSQRGSGALIANNVFDKINGPFITINGFPSVTIERNTDLQTCCNTFTLYGDQSPNLTYRGNVNDEKQYGIFGDGGTQGKAALDKFAPNWSMTGNVVAKPYVPWPDGNQVVDALIITSDYRTPYSGTGADIDALLAAQAGSGVSAPSPSPSVTATVTVSPSSSPTSTPTATGTPTSTITPTPTGTPTPAPPSPTPSATPVASPSPSPKPSPSPALLPFCRRGERPGNPPHCRCRDGMLGNSGKCA